MPRAPRRFPTGEEVLFLTSSTRLHNAFIRWYTQSYPTSETNLSDAAVMSRGLLRYLVIPTATELEAREQRRMFLSDDT